MIIKTPTLKLNAMPIGSFPIFRELFVLVLITTGVSLFAQETEKNLVTIERMIELCREHGELDYSRRVQLVNDKIELLKVVRKAKVDARQESKAETTYPGNAATPTHFAVFKTNKDKKEKVESLSHEILAEKSAIFSHGRMAIPEMAWNRILPFGIPPYGQVFVSQVTGKDSFHAKFCPVESTSKRMKFSGIETAFMTDEQIFKITRPIVIQGTSSYETVIGSSNTIAAWRNVTDDELDHVMKAIDASRPARAKKIWSDVTGNFQTEAYLVSFDGRLVKLEKTDGNIVEIEITKLSRDDQSSIQKDLGFEPR